MTDRRKWWWAAAVAGAFASVWCIYRLVVLGHHGTLCHLPLITDDKAILGATRSPGACLEYWFNRYQTLLGVLAAIGAAWLAWKAAEKNVSRVDAGLALSRQQIAISAVAHLSARSATLHALRQRIKKANEVTIRPDIEQARDYLENMPRKNEVSTVPKIQSINAVNGFQSAFGAYHVKTRDMVNELTIEYDSLILTATSREAFRLYIEWISLLSNRVSFVSQGFHMLGHDLAQDLPTMNSVLHVKSKLREAFDVRHNDPLIRTLDIIRAESDQINKLLNVSLLKLEQDPNGRS